MDNKSYFALFILHKNHQSLINIQTAWTLQQITIIFGRQQGFLLSSLSISIVIIKILLL